MSTPPTSTPWVPIYPPKAVPNLVPPPVNGKWAAAAGGAMVWQDLPVMLPGVVTPDTNWHIVGAAGEPPFLNGWTSVPDLHRPARFRKTLDGLVFLEGVIDGGNAQSVAAFYLPVGYRPLPAVGTGTEMVCHFYTGFSAGGSPFGTFWVMGSGEVRPYLNGGWNALDGITFYAG